MKNNTMGVLFASDPDSHLQRFDHPSHHGVVAVWRKISSY